MLPNLPSDIAAKVFGVCLIVVGAFVHRCHERPPWNRGRAALLGPGLVGFGVVLLLWPQPAWDRCTSDDGAVSVRMPMRPTRSGDEAAEAGKTPAITLRCAAGQPPVSYAFAWNSSDEDAAADPDPIALERLKLVHTETGRKIVSAAVVRVGERPAFDLEVILPDGKNRLRARYVYLGRMMYSAQVAAADLALHEADVNRFFDSFRIERVPAP